MKKKKYFYLKKSDVFLMCSNTRAESFGISILEAISCGLPLVISNVKGSGMNDMIVNNVNGLKFKKNSLNDCVKKLLMISKNKNNIVIEKCFTENSIKNLMNCKRSMDKIRVEISKKTKKEVEVTIEEIVSSIDLGLSNDIY